MFEARRAAVDVNRKAEQADRASNSERWSSIWYEAYQNYRSKAKANAGYKIEEKAIVSAQTDITTLTMKIKSLKSFMNIAKAKLAKGLEVMQGAENQLDVQVEVQHRHR